MLKMCQYITTDKFSFVGFWAQKKPTYCWPYNVFCKNEIIEQNL